MFSTSNIFYWLVRVSEVQVRVQSVLYLQVFIIQHINLQLWKQPMMRYVMNQSFPNTAYIETLCKFLFHNWEPSMLWSDLDIWSWDIFRPINFAVSRFTLLWYFWGICKGYSYWKSRLESKSIMVATFDLLLWHFYHQNWISHKM